MIRMLIGLPGDGKTLYSMQMIIRELVFSERKIVTNIEEIELGRLGEYIEQKYPDARIDLDQRLKIIPKALTQDFFRHRAGDLVLPEVPQNGRDGKRLLREDFLKLMVDYFLPVAQTPETMTPVTYFLDEAHEYFPASEWADIGRGVLWYASKHRHLHDEVYLITQAPGQIAATLRRLVAETYQVKNWYRMGFGPFKRPGCFKVYSYYGCADAGATAKDAYESSSFKLDAKGIASTYRTTGALGVLGREEGKSSARARFRLPYWTLWAAGGGALAAVFWLIQLMPGFVEKALVAPAFKVGQVAAGGAMQAGSAVVAPAQPAPAVAASAPAPQPGFRFLPAAAPAPADSAAAAPSEEAARLAVAGVARRGRMITVTLTDGTVWTEGSPELERVDRAGAVIAGKRLPFVRPAASAKPGQAASAPAPAVAAATPGAPAVAAADEGSWQRGADGVSRLKEKQSIGR
jgi:hypothetical protein